MTMNPIRCYMEVGGLLWVGYALVWAAARVHTDEPRRWLRIGHAVFLLAFALPLAASLVPRQAFFRPSVQVWSGHPRGTSKTYTLLAPASQPSARPVGWAVGDGMLSASGGILLLLLAFSLVRHGMRLTALRKRLRGHTEIRRIGRVSVLISEEDPVAYSAWVPGRAYVVLPMVLIGHAQDFRIALRHEIQHHRQRDTLWVHVFEISRALYAWNPAVYGWARLVERLQELACDEILIGRRKVSPQAYGSCLLRAAQQAMGSSAVLAGTTGMAASASGLFLKRRVEMLFVADRKRSSKSFLALFVLGTVAVMATTAFAARGLIQDRALTLAEAQALAQRSPQGEIPITVNERVLNRLNQYLGTPEGRERVKEALTRMPMYQPMIERKLTEYGFPHDLLAMPLTESGFRNDVVSDPPYGARGIWQFIAPTAHHYHLAVDDHVDERLDVEKETDAAMRYLRDLMTEFQDWRLALMGYNEGEKHLRTLMGRYHTRDPWKLEDLGTTEDYLAKTTAMILILRNPSLLD
jgi:membrane-bound lytic murein transglycosylase D